MENKKAKRAEENGNGAKRFCAGGAGDFRPNGLSCACFSGSLAALVAAFLAGCASPGGSSRLHLQPLKPIGVALPAPWPCSSASTKGGEDQDGNGLDDFVEKRLAEKFCPSLVLHSKDQGVSPEPVEFIGAPSAASLWVEVKNERGERCGTFPLADRFDPPLFPALQASGNYSGLKSQKYIYFGRLPKAVKAGRYWVSPYHEYAGTANKPAGWYGHYRQQAANFPNTVYPHLFKLEDGKTVIQFWYFYPFNDCVNNHEGDWEHINVVLSGEDTLTAAIEWIDFYFHHKVIRRWIPGVHYLLVDGTHPVVFVGGYGRSKFLLARGKGQGSHGSFPAPGKWAGVENRHFCVAAIGEIVDGAGAYLPHHSFDLQIIPDPHAVDYVNNPQLSWLNAPIPWGHKRTASPGAWLPIDVGNRPPLSPPYNPGWNRTGKTESRRGYAWYSAKPPLPPAGWTPFSYLAVSTKPLPEGK